MPFKKCKRPCKYRSSTPNLNGCDFILVTGKPRGCKAGDKCTKFEKVARAPNRVELIMPVKEQLSTGQYAARDYAEEQKKRIARKRDTHHKY